MLVPTTAWNENYFIYRTGRGFDLEQLDDVILPSPHGGRHLSRAAVRAGTVLAARLGNGHLVHQADAGKSRQQQATRIGVDADSTDLPYLWGGDTNQVEPLRMGRLEYVPGDSAWSTYIKWGATKATTGRRIDHFAVDGMTVTKVETRGIKADGTWTTSPRPGDHQAVVVDVTIPL